MKVREQENAEKLTAAEARTEAMQTAVEELRRACAEAESVERDRGMLKPSDVIRLNKEGEPTCNKECRTCYRRKNCIYKNDSGCKIK